MAGKDLRNRSRHHRVIARLNREQLDFLDKKIKLMRFFLRG